MKVLSYSEARANFARVLDAVTDDAEETVVHRSGHEPVVLISLAQWNSWKETEYLLSNPANAERLRHSIAQLESGDVITAALSDLDTFAELSGDTPGADS